MSSVARRYAKAVLELAHEQNKLEPVGGSLAAIAEVIEGSKELKTVLCTSLFDLEERKAVLKEILTMLKVLPLVSDFTNLLLDKGRLALIRDIERYYQERSDELAGRVRVDVVSSLPMDDGAKKKISEGLGTAMGKTAVCTFNEDPKLLAGLVAQIGSVVLDASLRTQIDNLKEMLQRGA